MSASPKHLGILLFDDVEELDAVGPYEVLAAWSRWFPDDAWSVTTMSSTGDAVLGAKGLSIVPHLKVADAPPLDVLVHPGGQGTRPMLDGRGAPRVAARSSVPGAARSTSVCTGSLVLAAAGLLAGRPATTHWASLDALAALDETIDVRRDVRFVDDGDVITSAGVSAGIDMALHLVARLSSTTTAAAVRKGIQYDPDPPV